MYKLVVTNTCILSSIIKPTSLQVSKYKRYQLLYILCCLCLLHVALNGYCVKMIHVSVKHLIVVYYYFIFLL